ncbi:caspase a-like%2C partial [Scomber scombrus]|uniref:Caspase a-like, partial n=2 Tax=Scomber scombrus TaxID=13677 RepID=A0AAV1QID0_SCOSC
MIQTNLKTGIVRKIRVVLLPLPRFLKAFSAFQLKARSAREADGTEQEMEEMLPTVQESSNQDLTSVVTRSNSNGAESEVHETSAQDLEAAEAPVTGNETEKPISPPAVEETSTQNTTSAPPETSNDTDLKPQWQFQKRRGDWCDFRKKTDPPNKCSLTNDDIERLYQEHLQDKLPFTVEGHSYKMDFDKKSLTNLNTGIVHSIRRMLVAIPHPGTAVSTEFPLKARSANKDLSKVGTKFVEMVSEDLIKQLLDDLLEDGIVKDGERGSILKENSTRTHRARSLIDTVKGKGDKASRKFIDHIYVRNPSLYKDLGLSSGQPVQPAAESQTKKGWWSTTLIPTTAEFWREKQNDKSIYTVTKDSIRSRVALLITNIKFTDEVMNRKGAEKDEQNMEELLTALGYEVVKYTNLTGKKIEEAVIKFSKHPKLKETDSVFVVIMSHGKRGAVLGVDFIKGHRDREQDNFPIDDIYKHLDTEHCPDLLNKPKIIIIQADRGEKGGSVRNAHNEKDFIRFLSCTTDTVSYRHPDDGSFLIQYIVGVLNTFAHQDHIEELFKIVMQHFKEDFPSLTKRQMPTKDRCTLHNNFYLFPDVQESSNQDLTSGVIHGNGNEAERIQTDLTTNSPQKIRRVMVEPE